MSEFGGGGVERERRFLFLRKETSSPQEITKELTTASREEIIHPGKHSVIKLFPW